MGMQRIFNKRKTELTREETELLFKQISREKKFIKQLEEEVIKETISEGYRK